jgi:ferredoxin/protein involved in ribonucleotide reduction
MMTKIYYFSGTGNTLAAAKRLSLLLDGEVFNIAGCMQMPEYTAFAAERIVLMFPAYAYGVPFIVRRFVQRFRFDSPYIAALVTYGSAPGGALAEIAAVMKKQGRRLSFVSGIPSVENYIPIFGTPSEDICKKRLALQHDAVNAAALALAAGKQKNTVPFHPFSRLISGLFRLGKKFFVQAYTLNKKCNGCGLCVKICPVAAITLQNGKPVFGGACEHCQACLNWCPCQAVDYMRLKPGVPRYHHPDIEVAEMIVR